MKSPAGEVVDCVSPPGVGLGAFIVFGDGLGIEVVEPEFLCVGCGVGLRELGCLCGWNLDDTFRDGDAVVRCRAFHDLRRAGYVQWF